VRSLLSRIPTQAVARLSGSDWRPEYGDILFLASRGKRFDHFEHRFPPGEFEREARAAGAALLFHDPGDATAVLVAGESSAPGPALAP
jgi:hypothetical protein